jgi:hypothetical protein
MAPSPLAQTTSWEGLVFYVIGSVLFTAGGLGFVLSTTTYVQSWLLSFQFGAFVWIIGSVAYLVPLVSVLWMHCRATSPRQEEGGCPDGDSRRRCCGWELGQFFSAVGLLCFIVGCSLGFFGPEGIANEQQVVRNLPAINAAFMVGSAVLLVNPIHLLLISFLPCYSYSKTPPPDDGSESKATLASPLSSVDWWYETAVAASFTYASASGGYGLDHDTVASGMVFWVVGSVVLLVQAVHLIVVKAGTSAARDCTGEKGASIQATEHSRSDEESPV